MFPVITIDTRYELYRVHQQPYANPYPNAISCLFARRNAHRVFIRVPIFAHG